MVERDDAVVPDPQHREFMVSCLDRYAASTATGRSWPGRHVLSTGTAARLATAY